MSHHTTEQHGSAGGGGFLSKLRGQAEAALAKVPAYNEMQHVVRQGMVQADPRQSPHTLKTQLAIKGCKGIIIDEDALARETKSFSKNMLDLAREENRAPGHDSADIQDVVDRAAYLTYKTGELHAEYAKRLELSRVELKEIRNHEQNLTPHRDRRAQLEKEIGRLRTNAKPDTATQNKINALQTELAQLSGPDSPLAAAEATALAKRREQLAKTFKMQFTALQELGEKLAIVASYGQVLVEGWDVSANAGKNDYVDGARTAGVRDGVESALASWSSSKTHVPRPQLPTGSKSTAPSFMESHASELASIHTVEDPFADHAQAMESYYAKPPSPTTSGPAATPAAAIGAYPAVPNATTTSGSAAMPISGAGSSANTSYGQSPLVQNLNNAPVTSLPGVAASPSTGSGAAPGLVVSGSSADGSAPVLASGQPATSSAATHANMPTVAETGAPITGTGGPSSGVLRPAAAKSKEDEAREETNRRFAEYFQGTSGADLDRNASVRTTPGGEQLPAYAPLGDAQAGTSSSSSHS